MRIGIDLGGTKIEGLALDEAGRELARQRTGTPGDEGYDAIVQAVVALVRAIEATTGSASTIGIGTPGAISPVTGLLQNSNTTCMNRRPLDRDLEAALGREVRLANDANCFALSEAVDGAAAGLHNVFGVIVGTGTGGGLVIDGKVVVGRHAVAGEWGHNPLPWPSQDEQPGPECYCGRRGCIETYLSGPGLSADHHRTTGQMLEPSALAKAAAAGDADARATLERYANRMARGLASIINVLDPDAIVLGGGLCHLDYLYERVPELWGPFVSVTGPVQTRLLKAKHGDSSGVRGAAWL